MTTLCGCQNPSATEPQRDEPPKTAFLFLAFLCASFCQRKAANDLDFLCGEVNKGNPHLCVPLFRLRRNSPFVALSDAMRVSVSAETDHRSARWTSGLFLKKETQKLSAMSRHYVTDKSKFEMLICKKRVDLCYQDNSFITTEYFLIISIG